MRQQAEFMLKRSQRIRHQEDLVLPLYEPLATNAAEGDFHAPLFSVLCGLAVASNDTVWEKLTFITDLFRVNDRKVGYPWSPTSGLLTASCRVESICWGSVLANISQKDLPIRFTKKYVREIAHILTASLLLLNRFRTPRAPKFVLRIRS